MPSYLSPRAPRRIARAITTAPRVLWDRVLFPALAVTSALFVLWFVCVLASGANAYAAMTQ